MLQIVDHGSSARAALLGEIADRQAGDPLAPVTVVVPSPLAGLALRRVVATERGGFANVRFTVLARLAELLGAPRLAASGRRPLTPAVRMEAIHAALLADPGPLRAVAAHPATAQALAATFDDLRGLDDAALDALGARERGGRAATVVRLLRSVRTLTIDCYDADAVANSAAAALGDGDASGAEVGHVIAYLPREITPGDEALLRSFADAGRLTVLLGRTGDPAVDAEAVALATRLGVAAASAGKTPPAPTAQRIVSAPDPEEEVRAIARDLQRRARDGAALGRIAVVSRLAEPYGRLVPEIFDAAGIPWTGAIPRRLAESTAARVLLGVLGLGDDDLARDDVAAWLASGPIYDPGTGHLVSATRWDLLSREAGVVRGASQWAERLERRRAAIDAELSDVAILELPEWRHEQLRSTRDDLGDLARFVTDLAAALQEPSERTWHAFSAWARDLLFRFLGDEARRGRWPDTEIEAAQRVEATLDELSALDAVGSPVDAARLRRALEAELDAPVGRTGRFGAGVLVGTLRDAYAGHFDTVYVLGAVEGALPPRGREDPLLSDRERREHGLALHASRRLEERRDYLAALASAAERILVFPRADPRAQRARLPAQWVVETARALGATELTAERLRDDARAPWLDFVESFEASVTRGEPASCTEYRLRALGASHAAGADLTTHPLTSGAVARGFAAARARLDEGASPYNGVIGASPHLAPGVHRPISPTALEEWAACPFRYFLARVLRVRDVPRPEDLETMTALDQGALIHEILEEFVRNGATGLAPTTHWTDTDQARLDALVAARCEEAERRGITGRKVAWIIARRQIAATARRFLTTDEYARALYGVVPAPDGVERSFGDSDHAPIPLELADGRTVALRGRIDRIDRSPDGRRALVYDYKTGKLPKDRARDLAKDPVDAGKALQLPLYALAARAEEGADEAIACFWYTREEAEAALIPLELHETEERFLEVVGSIVEGISAGCFPGVPGDPSWNNVLRRDTWKACAWCPFDRLCPVERAAIWERVRGDDASAPFRALALADRCDEPDGDPDDADARDEVRR